MFLTASPLDLCSSSEHFCSSSPGCFLSRNQLFSDFRVKAESVCVVGDNCRCICRCRADKEHSTLISDFLIYTFFLNSRTQPDIVDFQVHCQPV